MMKFVAKTTEAKKIPTIVSLKSLMVDGSEFVLDVDTVIVAIGNSPNPIIPSTTPGLDLSKWGTINIDEESGMSSVEGVFAGGDIVTGAATVISATGAGKHAARGIHKYLGGEIETTE